MITSVAVPVIDADPDVLDQHAAALSTAGRDHPGTAAEVHSTCPSSGPPNDRSPRRSATARGLNEIRRRSSTTTPWTARGHRLREHHQPHKEHSIHRRTTAGVEVGEFPVNSLDILNEVYAQFSNEEVQQLAEHDRSDRDPTFPATALNVLATWTWDVGVLAGQLDRSFFEDVVRIWAARDLEGCLHDRERVARVLRESPAGFHHRLRVIADAADDILREFTEPDESKRVVSLARMRQDSLDWWWYRIPIRGPVRQEHDGIALTGSGLGEIEVRPHFTADELAVLDAIELTSPRWKKPLSLLPAVSAWGAAARIVARQLTEAPPLPYLETWDVAALVAALKSRDVAGALLPRVPPSAAATVRGVLDGHDVEYRATTSEDAAGRLLDHPTVTSRRGPESWWWYRVPVSGPIRAELDG